MKQTAEACVARARRVAVGARREEYNRNVNYSNRKIATYLTLTPVSFVDKTALCSI